MSIKSTFRQLLGSVRFDWKRLFIPSVIDMNSQAPQEQKSRKWFNLLFETVFGIILVTVTLYQLPDMEKMIYSACMVVIAYVAFCAIMNSVILKKDNRGRKPKDKPKSFEDLFLDHSIFVKVDDYIRSKYTPENLMISSDCRTLLGIVIDNGWVKDDSLSPMAKLVIQQYSQILSFKTPRSVTGAKCFQEKEREIKNELGLP